MRHKKVYDKKIFANAVAESFSWRQLAAKLGENYSGTTYRILPRTAKKLGISTKHFLGVRWRKGSSDGCSRSLEDILIKGKVRLDAKTLVPRLVDAGLKQRICNSCSHDMWLGQPIPLVLSHKNSIQTDYRLMNLELLCYNCYRIKTNRSIIERLGSKNAENSGNRSVKHASKKT